jgi:hypothetical protein
MRKVQFKYKEPGCDRRHFINEEDVLVVLGRLPEEAWQRLRVVHFNDRGFGVRTLGYATSSSGEIEICALPPNVSLTRFLARGQTCREFGVRRGAQWPEIAVRRFLLYDVLLHELGHLRRIDERTKSERLRFAREKKAQEFADRWRRQLWSEQFEHPDTAHNAPNHA